MPAHIRGTRRELLRFVLINPVFCYGWKTIDLAAIAGVSAADIAALGHMDSTAANAVANRVMVVGANSPKPGRVTRKFPGAVTTQRGSVSTFVGFNAQVAAVGAGWTLAGFPKGVRLTAPGPSRRSITAVAELSDGTRYAFPLNQADFELVRVPLGLQNSTEITTAVERQRLATGMSSTKPGLASNEDSGGSLSTFYATASEETAAAAGFTIKTRERIAFPLAPIGP